MKRSIPFILVLVLALSAGTYLVQDSSQTYTPRESMQPAATAAGAAQVRHDMLADPATGEINYDHIAAVEAALDKMTRNAANKNNELEWTSAGPNNVGGRTRAIMSFEDDPTRVFAGSVSGGLYQSFNSGEEWSLVESFDDNIAVASIARTGNGKIYVGTGHFAEGFRGDGLYVSEDEGASWNTVQNFRPDDTFQSNSVWSRINVLVADPVNDNRVWIAHTGGLSTYTWGATDIEEWIGTGTTSLSISNDGQTIIAVSSDRVYVSTNGGVDFSDRSGINFGLVPSSGIGRLEVAVSPDNPNYMYALAAAPNGYLKGVYGSTNAGQTWWELFGSSDNGSLPFSPFSVAEQGQGNYDNCITVIPGHPDQAIIGGIRMYLIEVTGENPPIPQWNALNVNFNQGGFNPDYVHSDIHTFHWDSNDVFYIGCDGGVFKSSDLANSFLSSNYNYRSTQFYGIDFNSDGMVIGGTQDNGNHIITGFNISNNDSQQIPALGGGDGFDASFSKYDPKIAFGSSYFNNISRTFDGAISGSEIVTEEDYPGPFWTVLDLDETINASNAVSNTYISTQDWSAGETIEYTSENYNSIFSYELTEDLSEGETILLPDPNQSLFCVGGIGSFRMTRDGTKNTVGAGDIDWAQVSSGVSGTITCFEFSPDHDKLYIGSTTGQVYRVSGLNEAYDGASLQEAADNTLTTIYSGGGTIRDMAVDYNNNNRLLIAKPGYSTADKVFLSEDAANTTDASSFEGIWNFPSNLSLMPAYSCQFDVNTPNRILVGTEYGVWISDDLGDSWEECNTSMGRVPVYALEQQVLTSDDMLPGVGVLNEGAIYAGTYGKGIFYVGDYILGVDNFDLDSNDLITDLSIYPNPVAENATLTLELLESQNVNLQIFDMKGRMIVNLPQGKLLTGEHIIPFNVSTYSEGTYLISVQAGVVTQNIRFIVSR